MILNIGGRDYTLIFGLDFLIEMNKLHSAELEGMKTGYGAMTLLSAGQALNDPMAFIRIIKAGTITEPQKPSNVAVWDCLNGLINDGKYHDTLNEIFEELKASPLLKMAMNIVE